MIKVWLPGRSFCMLTENLQTHHVAVDLLLVHINFTQKPLHLSIAFSVALV